MGPSEADILEGRREGLLTIRNRERLLNHYGPGTLAVDPGVSESSGFVLSVEAQQRSANIQEECLARELVDAETSLVDSVRAAAMHRVALRGLLSASARKKTSTISWKVSTVSYPERFCMTLLTRSFPFVQLIIPLDSAPMPPIRNSQEQPNHSTPR
jgi:hypothetical protein